MGNVAATTIIRATTAGGDDDDEELFRRVLGMSERPAPAVLVSGQVIDDKYRIDGELGAGGMGRVYRAHDLRLGRDIAIKLHVVVAIDGKQWGLREASALARLSHPNAVTVFEVGTWSGHPWVAMEYVPGGTARTWLDAAPRSAREILDLYIAAGRGLAAAHDAGIVHRDFKPDNVLVTEDGQPRVADFGLALELDEGSGHATNLVMGTPAYMAPEQWARGSIGPTADQFAFAVALWEALSGVRPFDADTEPALALALTHPPKPPAKPIARHVEVALRRALAHDPAHRWPAMAPLLVELARDPARTRRRIAIASFAGIAVLGIGAAGATMLGGTTATVEDPCLHAGEEIDRAVSSRAAIAPKPDDRSLGKLDAYLATWRTSSVAACRDTHVTRAQPVAIFEQRSLCLERARVSAEATIDAIVQKAEADRDALVDRLPPLGDCADVNQLANLEPLPVDPAARLAIYDVTGAITRAEVLRNANQPGVALGTVIATVPRADATGRRSLAAYIRRVLASFLVGNGLYQVMPLLEEAVKLASSVHDDVMVAGAYLDILDLYLNRLEQPEPAIRMMFTVEAAVLRAGDTARLHGGLAATRAELASARGELADAKRFYEEALALHIVDKGEDGEAARMLNRLGQIAGRADDMPAARAHLERAADVLERAYGPRAMNLASVWTTLSSIEALTGNTPHAIELLRKALALKETVYGPDAVAVVPTLSSLAQVLAEADQLEEAAKHGQRALAIARKQLGPVHMKIANALKSLATIEFARENYPAMEALVREALAMHAQLGTDGEGGYLELQLALALTAQRKYGEAHAAIARGRKQSASMGPESSRAAQLDEAERRLNAAEKS